jgi:hypothetical protein
MKIKHNKKRNTAFVYESLIKEATIAILKKDIKRKQKVINLIKKHFIVDSLLKKDLECYRSLYETIGLKEKTSERLLKEAKLASRVLDVHGLFIKQTDLINDVNQELSPSVFNNFVPNYKTLATIAQIFSGKLSPRNTVILENQILEYMCMSAAPAVEFPDIDDVVYNSLTKKFNNKYEIGLLEEQKTLLNCFVSSFSDNSVSLKTFLNSEIFRLKQVLGRSLEASVFKEDRHMHEKATKVIEKLDRFYKEGVSEEVLLTVLKTQALVEEIFKDADKS